MKKLANSSYFLDSIPPPSPNFYNPSVNYIPVTPQPLSTEDDSVEMFTTNLRVG